MIVLGRAVWGGFCHLARRVPMRPPGAKGWSNAYPDGNVPLTTPSGVSNRATGISVFRLHSVRAISISESSGCLVLLIGGGCSISFPVGSAFLKSCCNPRS